ncbi:hypothetical protein [Kitasatospora sp. NPDC101183]|uniref:hypothetical protein n=1 Tax=Kitasatospora sp. NPDC101183 TaxID=3364100 RepID=UPI0038236318
MRRSPIVLAAALLAAAPLLAACDSGTEVPATPGADKPIGARPSTEVALPTLREAGQATGPYPATPVSVAVGERFGVKGVDSTTPYRWKLTSSGDAALVRQGSDVVVEPCGGETGCSPGVDQVFTARAAGTTTLTWTYEPQGGCRTPPVDPCGRVTKSFLVTVR